MKDRFDGEIGARLCVECDSFLTEQEGDGLIMRVDHCAGCSESCDCPPEPLVPNRPTATPEHRSPYWLRSRRHG